MLMKFPAVSVVQWNPAQEGVCHGIVECRRPCLPALRSCYLGQKLQFGYEQFQANGPTTSGAFIGASQRSVQGQSSKKWGGRPQNVDLPPILPKKKKKPYPIPLKKILQASKADKKLAQMGIEKPLESPKNGLLVPDMIPVACEVLSAWKF